MFIRWWKSLNSLDFYKLFQFIFLKENDENVRWKENFHVFTDIDWSKQTLLLNEQLSFSPAYTKHVCNRENVQLISEISYFLSFSAHAERYLFIRKSSLILSQWAIIIYYSLRLKLIIHQHFQKMKFYSWKFSLNLTHKQLTFSSRTRTLELLY